MRLLLLTEYFPPHAGGTAVYYYEVLRRVPADITVVTRTCPGAASFDAKQPFIIVRTPFPPIPKVRMVVEWWSQFIIGLWLAVTRRIDVIQCGQVFPLGLAAYGIHILTHIPYVVYIHGEEVTIAARHPWKRAVVSFLLRHASVLFVNSWFSATRISALGVSGDRTHVVCPGVDPKRFRPMEATALRSRLGGGGRRVLLSTGRLVPRKGYDTVIRLLPSIAAVIPDVVYWIAGGGSAIERRRLQKLATAVGVADRVRFLAEVSNKDLPTLYAACDVFVMLNRTMPDGDVEGFGIVFLEAGACGKPVVGGRSGGAVEAVRDGQTGFLIPEGDDSAAISTLVRLLSDADLRARLGKAARRRAIRHFSWSRTACRVAQVIGDLKQPATVGSIAAFEGRLARW